MGTVSFKFYPNDRKKIKKTQKTPIYVRIRKDDEKVESRLNWALTPEERSRWNDVFDRVEIKDAKVNDYLNRIEDRYKEFLILNAATLNEYDAAEIRDKVLGQERSKKKVVTLLNFVTNHYESNIAKSSKYAEGTKKNYRKAIRHLRRYLSYTKQTNLRIDKVNYKFANSFANYMMSDHPENDHKAMTEVSACGNIKKFRTILNHAVNEQLITTNPFKQVKLSYRSPEKPKLSLQQFKRLRDYKGANKVELSYVQVFLFMCYTGTAFLDCQDLTLNNLEQTTDGIKLIYKRNKTGHTSEQYLTDQAIELIETFHKRPDVQTTIDLVPRVSNQHFNRTLKLVAAKLGIQFNLTTHHGRHTYRSLLDDADVVDPTVIKKLMGWSNLNSMDGIYRKVTDSRLLKTKIQLEDFLRNL
jgi:site-specific recombinase XerD